MWLWITYAGYIEAASKAGLIQGYNGYLSSRSYNKAGCCSDNEESLRFWEDKKSISSVPNFIDKDKISQYALEAVKIMYD